MHSNESAEEPLLVNTVNCTQSTSHEAEYQEYVQRWFMLAVIVVLNLSNGMIWLTFGNIADSTSIYYDVSPMSVNWLSLVFMITTVGLGIIAIWLLDNKGLRICLIIAAWLNGIGAVGRILSTLDFCKQHRYVVLLTSQTLAGCSQPFMMFTSTKLAAHWFNENQRTFANMLGSTANPIGIMLGGILSTVIIPTTEKQDNMPLLLEIFAIPAVLGILMASFGVCSSLPPTPPSSSAAEAPEPFFSGLKKLAHIRSYWVLAACYGAGTGLLSSFVTILDQLLCVHGYSDSFVGICCVLLFGIGLVGATVISLVVDRTRQFELAAKLCFAVAACTLITFMILAHYHNLEIILALLCAFIGFFGLALNPICLELSVECTFPVAEGTTAGILILSGQIQAVIYTLIMAIGINTDISQAEMCNHGDIIQMYAVIVFMVITGISTLMFILFFHCNYRRMQIEQQLRAEIVIQENSRHPVS